MKTTKIKKKSKSNLRILIDEADRALQNWFRLEYAGTSCESCGNPFELMHHYYEKSRSSFLRFDHRNLIFICKRCHALHHQFHDQRVMARVIVKRGIKWFEDLYRDSTLPFQITQDFLQQQKVKYGIIKKT